MSVTPPLFSIIIPAYKAADYIGATLVSVYGQSVRDFEILVINDGSPDNLLEVLAKECDPRLRVINQSNAGVSAARNRAIAEAQGKYIALLDSDDIWLPWHLEMAQRALEAHPELAWYASRYLRIEGSLSPEQLKRPCPESCGLQAINWYSEGGTLMLPSCTVIRREGMESADFFPLGVKMYEDSLAWSQFARKHPMIALLDDASMLYIIHDQSACAHYDLHGYDRSMEGTLWQQMAAAKQATDCSAEAKVYYRSFKLMAYYYRRATHCRAPRFMRLIMRRVIRIAYNRTDAMRKKQAIENRVQLEPLHPKA